MFSPTTPRLVTTFVATAALTFAVFAPSASAQRQDLRSPDVRDAAAPVTQVKQDLRAPDVRDAAEGYAPAPVSEPVATSTSSPSDGGFDWVRAAIGVAAVGGAIVLVLAAAGQRRRHGPVGA